MVRSLTWVLGEGEW